MEEQDAAKPTSERHVPVLKDRCINLLAPGFEAARKRGATPVAIDATLGMGGHSEALLERIRARVIYVSGAPARGARWPGWRRWPP